MLSEKEISNIINETFFAYMAEAMNQISPSARFAHYTSADVAMQIITSAPDQRSLWLRNATEMNDFSEVEYGQHCLRSALADERLFKHLQAAFDAVHPEIVGTAVTLLDDEFSRVKSGTYLLSLALHDGEARERGLLSMWRAYGGDANVCLLLNPAPFLTPQTAYGSYISPVYYGGPAGFKGQLEALVARVEANRDKLRQVDPQIVSLNFKFALDAAILSTKHPSFEEEQEWRLIYRPDTDTLPQRMPSKVASVGGIVQLIHYVPMRNVPEHGVMGAELDEILYRLLIGPTPNPPLVREAFVELLRTAGVTDPNERVKISAVPLRR